MKKVLSVLALLIGLNAVAQQRAKQDLSPEQVATLATKKMTLDLDLDESQQTKVYQLHLENAKARQGKKEEFKKAKEDGTMKKMSSDERYSKSTEMLDRKIAEKKKMKAILTPQQYEKWEKMRPKKGHKRGGKNKEKGENEKSPRD